MTSTVEIAAKLGKCCRSAFGALSLLWVKERVLWGSLRERSRSQSKERERRGLVKKEAAPLVCVLVGGDGVRQGCLVMHVCCGDGYDAYVGCGGRRGQDMVGVGASVSRGGAELKKRGPSRVHQRREGQVRAGGDARVAVAVWCTWHGGTAWLGVTRHVDGYGVVCCVW